MSAAFDVLIVGAGHGGAQTAIALRQRGFAGTIAIVGDEPWLPYERPPLSKEYLAGDKPFERILIRPATFWIERAIEVLTETTVVAVDLEAHQVTLSDGARLDYGVLVWAAGGAPRRLTCDGHELGGVHAIRTRDDVDRLAREAAADPKVVIVGGGYIGLEAAAALTKRGLSITLLEAQDRVLARVAGNSLSRFYENEHRAHGVDLRTGAVVAGLEDENGQGRVTGVRLGDGSILPAGIVIVGIGIVPAVAPLLAAGAQGSNGVLVNEFCRTTLPDIYAIGDCAAHPNRFAGDAVIRLESVQNAANQAATVADAITGNPQPYGAVPWFWSNQYDLKLQTLGLSTGYDTAVVRGDMGNRSFSVGYFRGKVLIAIDCVNAVKDYVQARALVMAAVEVDHNRFADISVPLKSLSTG